MGKARIGAYPSCDVLNVSVLYRILPYSKIDLKKHAREKRSSLFCLSVVRFPSLDIDVTFKGKIGWLRGDGRSETATINFFTIVTYDCRNIKASIASLHAIEII